MARYQKRGGKTTYGKKFRTSKGRFGRYKYVNGKRVSFVTSNYKMHSRDYYKLPRRRY